MTALVATLIVCSWHVSGRYFPIADTALLILCAVFVDVPAIVWGRKLCETLARIEMALQVGGGKP